VQFDSPDLNLGDLMRDVGSGKIRLPDFQRDWKWDTDRIASLLASVSLSYPVGVLMLLETGGPDVQFATRLVSGVDEDAASKLAEQLILDGQQRLTSLYQALASGRVVATQDTRNKKLQRWYYLDMAACLADDGNREEAIIAMPSDRMLRDNFGRDVILDLSTTEHECREEMFPLANVFDSPAIDRWMVTYLQLETGEMPERLDRWSEFKDKVLSNITGYTVPVIVLKKDMPREAVCTIFEKVNTGGVVLDVFELLTAMFAATQFDLRADWEARYSRLARHKVLRGLQSSDFLQAVTLLATRERRLRWGSGDSDKAPAVSCRRRDILRLTRAEYERWAPELERGFDWAARFLNGERVFEARDIPYRTQLVPLAAIHVALGSHAELIGAVDKIRRWYWCGVLGELYGGAIETRFANDLVQVVDWVGGADAEPISIYESSFDPGRLFTLRTRNSAAYKGIYALLMARGCKDWLFDQDITLANHHQLAVDIHHIFPKAWCNARGVDDLRRESIVNKTAIAARTNRIIGGKAPSKYVLQLREAAGTSEAAIIERIEGHQIDFEQLASDNFGAFFELRCRALLDLIGQAMGKEIPDGVGLQVTIPDDYELDEEELSDNGDEASVG
jgi:hypothetical protein